MSRDNLIEIVMHNMDVKKEYLSKIKSLNDEIALLKCEEESLQDEGGHYYMKCKSLKDKNK